MSLWQAKPRPRRTVKDYAYLVFAGIVTGAANVIPGVSGGTMAFIMGIYEEILESIQAFNWQLAHLILRGRFKEALRHIPWNFLAPLGVGLVLAVFALAGLISWLMDNQSTLVYAFFFGLIVASIISVSGEVKWGVGTLTALLLGTLLAWVLVGLTPRDMPHTFLVVFICGVIAVIAMILPGISGSFLLLILGQYNHVLNLIKTVDILGLLPLALGIGAGLIGFVRFLNWLLKNYHQATVTLLLGFMLGSLRKIWPYKEVLETTTNRHGKLVSLREVNIMPSDMSFASFWLPLILAVLGFCLICVLDHLQSGQNPFIRLFVRPKNKS